MTKDQAAATLAVRVTRAAALFDRIIATLLVPVGQASTPARAVEEAERADLRERLDAFFPEFRQLYGGLLVKHIGAQALPAVLAALDSEAVQAYFRALQAMEPELLGGLQSLTKRMAVVAADRSGA